MKNQQANVGRQPHGSGQARLPVTRTPSKFRRQFTSVGGADLLWRRAPVVSVPLGLCRRDAELCRRDLSTLKWQGLAGGLAGIGRVWQLLAETVCLGTNSLPLPPRHITRLQQASNAQVPDLPAKPCQFLPNPASRFCRVVSARMGCVGANGLCAQTISVIGIFAPETQHQHLQPPAGQGLKHETTDTEFTCLMQICTRRMQSHVTR